MFATTATTTEASDTGIAHILHASLYQLLAALHIVTVLRNATDATHEWICLLTATQLRAKELHAHWPAALYGQSPCRHLLCILPRLLLSTTVNKQANDWALMIYVTASVSVTPRGAYLLNVGPRLAWDIGKHNTWAQYVVLRVCVCRELVCRYIYR